MKISHGHHIPTPKRAASGLWICPFCGEAWASRAAAYRCAERQLKGDRDA